MKTLFKSFLLALLFSKLSIADNNISNIVHNVKTYIGSGISLDNFFIFFRYGSKPFDWIAVDKNGTLAAKLEGINQDGTFLYTILGNPQQLGLYIKLENNGSLTVKPINTSETLLNKDKNTSNKSDIFLEKMNFATSLFRSTFPIVHNTVFNITSYALKLKNKNIEKIKNILDSSFKIPFCSKVNNFKIDGNFEFEFDYDGYQLKDYVYTYASNLQVSIKESIDLNIYHFTSEMQEYLSSSEETPRFTFYITAEKINYDNVNISFYECHIDTYLLGEFIYTINYIYDIYFNQKKITATAEFNKSKRQSNDYDILSYITDNEVYRFYFIKESKSNKYVNIKLTYKSNSMNKEIILKEWTLIDFIKQYNKLF